MHRSPIDILAFLVACMCLLLMKGAVRWLAFAQLTRWLGLRSAVETAGLKTDSSAGSERIAIAVKRAARRLPGEYLCLPQALTGYLLLKLWRIPSTVCIGVRLEADRSLKAHAWLTSGGRTVLGARGHESFKNIALFQ